jgi:hypothetical protein
MNEPPKPTTDPRVTLAADARKYLGDWTPDVSDDQLLRRAVRNARSHNSRGYTSRWIAVMSTFGLGSTYARALCQRFGFDPDEKVRI